MLYAGAQLSMVCLLLRVGEKVIELASGQVEVHTQSYRKRKYPDGTVKIVYFDGRQETQYASGRVRVKDKNGFLILDNNPSL